jgi:hypothetical protein
MRPLMVSTVIACLTACAPKSPPEEPAQATAVGCLPGGEGQLEAELRGAIHADIDWRNAQMECDGGLRPDGNGLRATIAGALDGERRLRFIFGIDFADTAAGPAQVLPTNLTVIIEGQSQVYATRGDDKCAVEDLQRMELDAGRTRVTARGYCIGPAADMQGGAPLLVPTFSFTAVARAEPADGPVAP